MVQPASRRLITEAALAPKLDEAGVMRGQVSFQSKGEAFVWRQTTESGHYLPLGYDETGHLDDFARKIWREDISNTEVVPAHPVYARVQMTENGELLYGLRWDGAVEIPGLLGAPNATPTPPLYNDMPYVPGSDIMPGNADPLNWAMWGSSSAYGIAEEMGWGAAVYGAKFYNGGVPSESSYHIAARLGSVPAEVSFPNGPIPASGSVNVASNIPYMEWALGYTGHVLASSGAKVPGALSANASTKGWTFTRTGSGATTPIAADAPFIPDAGVAHRGDTTFLWMGKNNSGQPERVIAETNASYSYLAPLVKRCMVLGHFVNTGTPAIDVNRTNIKQINDAHAARFGSAFLDVGGYLTSSQVWVDCGITPTQEDLAEQALGNKPPSLSYDSGHLNAPGHVAVRKLITKRVESLGWNKPITA